MKQLSTILKDFNPTQDKYISREFQKYGVYLSEELNDYKHKALYIKLAKTTNRALLEKAYSYVKDAKVEKPGALFMWKLKQLREEATKNKPKDTEELNKQNEKNKAIQKFFSGETIWSKIFLVLIFLVSSIFLILPFVFDIDFNTLLTFGIIGLFLINFLGSATIFLPAPAFLSVAVAGSSFNPLLVAIVASAGGALGESIAYLLGYSSTKVLNLKHHTVIYKISKTVMHWKGGILIPFFAFFPNPFFDGLGIIVGMSNYPAKRFILLTFIGRLVRNIGIAYLGLFIW